MRLAPVPDLLSPNFAHLLRVQAELRERLATGCALPAAERAHIKAMLAMVQGQLAQQGEPAKSA